MDNGKSLLFLSFFIMAFAAFSYSLTCEQASYPACFGTCTNVEYDCNNTITFDYMEENCLCDCPSYKEKVLNATSSLEIDGMKLRLGEVFFDKGEAFVKIFDENGNFFGEVKVSEGGYAKFTNPKTGNSILIKGIHIPPPSSAIWAEVSLFTDEITLEQGKRYNLASSDDPNWKHVRVNLLWKNREATATDGRADSLREIVLYVDDMSSYMTGNDNRMVAGDSVSFPKINTKYTLEYTGLDLQTADYEGLVIYVNSRTIVVGNADNCRIRNANYNTDFIAVSADSDNAFGGSSDALGGDRVKKFLIDPTGNFSLNGIEQYVNYTKANSLDWHSTVFWMPAGCDYYKMNRVLQPSSTNVSYINTTILTSFSNNITAVKFSQAGGDPSAYGAIRWYFVNNKNANNKKMQTTPYYGSIQLNGNVVGEIVLQEDAGKRDTTSHYPVMTRFPVYKDSTSTWKFKPSGISTPVAYYSGINDSDKSLPTHVQFATSYESPLYTDRGTKVTAISLSSIYLSVAKRVGYANFDFENSYQFSTLIHDAIDRTLRNRVSTGSEDKYVNNLQFSDSGNILSPLRGSMASNQQYLYRIGENEYSGFSIQRLIDEQASSEFQYNERQGYWVGSSSDSGSGVYYDSGISYREIVAKPNVIAYNTKFSGNDYGIPICTAGLSKTGDWASCALTSDRTDNHRLKIWFLGEQWIITLMQEPTTRDLFNSVGAKTGGKVKLAKEAKYEILNIDGIIDGGDFKARLVQVLPDGRAVFDILDADGKVIGQITVNPGSTYTFTQSSTGKSIKVHLYKASPGFQENWTEIRAYGPCPPGQEYNNETCKCAPIACEQSEYLACFGNCEKSQDFCVATFSGGNSSGEKCFCDCPAYLHTIMDIGNRTQIGNVYIRLADIDYDFEGDKAIYASFDLIDLNDVILKQIRLKEGETYNYIDQYGNSVSFSLVRGYMKRNLSEKWAEIRTYGPCGSGEIYNFETCSCEPNNAPYCGQGTDTKICTKDCQNATLECFSSTDNSCECACPADQQTMDIGGFFSNGGYEFVLKDIEVYGKSISLQLTYQGKTDTVKVHEGETYRYTKFGGNTATFKVIQILGGDTLSSKWAKIRFYPPCPQGKVYDESTCSCKPNNAPYCGESTDANICTKDCQNSSLQCFSSTDNSCECDCPADKVLVKYHYPVSYNGFNFTYDALPPYAGLSVSSEGEELEKIKYGELGTYSYESKSGKKINFRIIKQFLGLTLSDGWAELRVYPTCVENEEYNFDTCACEPIAEPLTFSCNQSFTQNRSYIKDFDFCANDCPTNRECNENSCKCECNQTQRNECQYPNIWHSNNCTCQIVEYCGAGNDTGICLLPCQNKNKQCAVSSPEECSCVCEEEQACNEPKAFNEKTCSCLCPEKETIRISINETIDGGKYNLRIMKMGENNGATYANIEIRGKDGSHKYWYPLGEGDGREYYNNDEKGGISFTITEINTEEGWVEIIIHPDCPAPKQYLLTDCACHCPSELKAKCPKPHIWNETNCTCEYVDALNFSCNNIWGQNRSYTNNFDICTNDCPQDFTCNSNTCKCGEIPKDTCASGFENGSLICTGICLNTSKVCTIKPLGLVGGQNWSLPNASSTSSGSGLSNLTPINDTEGISFCSCQPKCHAEIIGFSDAGGDIGTASIGQISCQPFIASFSVLGIFDIPNIYIGDAGCDNGCNMETGICQFFSTASSYAAGICTGACPQGLVCSAENSSCDCIEPEKFCSKEEKYLNNSCGIDDCAKELGDEWYCETKSCSCTKPSYCGEEKDARVCALNCQISAQDCSKPEVLNGECLCMCDGGKLVVLAEGKQYMYSELLNLIGAYQLRNEKVNEDGTIEFGLREGFAYENSRLVETKSAKEGDYVKFSDLEGNSVTVQVVKIDTSTNIVYINVYVCPDGQVYDEKQCMCVGGGIIQPPEGEISTNKAFVPWYE